MLFPNNPLTPPCMGLLINMRGGDHLLRLAVVHERTLDQVAMRNTRKKHPSLILHVDSSISEANVCPESVAHHY